MTPRAALGVVALVLAAACRDVGPQPVDNPPVASLASQLRDSVARWGPIPIGVMPAQPPELVALGRALVFDKILSGNRDISCATCHQPALHGTDGLALAIGTGGTGTGLARTLGPGRQFIPRNAPSLLNQGLRAQYLFWDGRLSGFGSGPFTVSGGWVPPTPTILAAQATLPVLNRQEMRGKPGDVDVFGNANELAAYGDADPAPIWAAIMGRLLAIPQYSVMFAAAFPNVPSSSLGFQHAATAIAAFLTQSFTHYDSPFDRFLARDDNAMSAEAMRGGLVFFGRARCGSCHGGPLLGGDQFANTGVPQVGPGMGPAAPLDRGRGDVTPNSGMSFWFRVPPLRNVELTAPYMHNGVFPTLEAVVRHYDDVTTSLTTYDVTQLPAPLRSQYHGDAATLAAITATMDFRVRAPLHLTDTEQSNLVAFLRSLTDPAARDLAALTPASVPSGLPVD